MKFQYGIPTEPGRYDCVFSHCVLQFCLISKRNDELEAVTARGDPADINEITQYLGPFPDPFQN